MEFITEDGHIVRVIVYFSDEKAREEGMKSLSRAQKDAVCLTCVQEKAFCRICRGRLLTEMQFLSRSNRSAVPLAILVLMAILLF